jgi:N-acetylglucosaminyl-diphospho-decaprenol L-rhamnosyltransferase
VILPAAEPSVAALPVTAILVAYDSAAVLPGALASLPAEMPVIVVDNASGDGSAAIAEAAGATVIRHPRNLGFGNGCNAGWRAAGTEWVMFLNPDARLRPGCLDALRRVIEEEVLADVLVPTVFSKGRVFAKRRTAVTAPAFRPGHLPRPAQSGTTPIAFASGAALLIRRERLRQIDGFDPEIFLYFEDDDLSRRLLDIGCDILLVGAAEVEHAGGVSTAPSPHLAYLKHWHLAWSERHVRGKFGLMRPGVWRVLESVVKMVIAQLRRDRMEVAKQLGLINGTLGHMRGMRAMDVRDSLTMDRE